MNNGRLLVSGGAMGDCSSKPHILPRPRKLNKIRLPLAKQWIQQQRRAYDWACAGATAEMAVW